MKKAVFGILILVVFAVASGCAMNDYLDGSDHSSHYDDSQDHGGHSGHMH